MNGIPPDLALVIVSALINAAVTWGVMRTQLQWLRRDVDQALDRLDDLQGIQRRRRGPT
jgi:uncharacterized protein HemY